MIGKKMIFAGAAVVMTFSLSVLPAFAHGHGHHGGHHGSQTVQTVPDSSYNTGAAGSTDINTGADLSAETDTTSGTNTAAMPSAYPVCNFEGCTIIGHHLHDGSYYCGYHHENGYCDGSCISSSPAINSSSAVDNSSADSLPAASGYGYVRKYNCHRSYARKLFYCH